MGYFQDEVRFVNEGILEIDSNLIENSQDKAEIHRTSGVKKMLTTNSGRRSCA